MFFIIYYMCWVLPLFASRTYRGADNWENAINSCNLTIFNADNSNGEHSSKIWQPFVQIMTYPIITKGCHKLTSQIIKSSTVMEKNNITNCYHFCWFNQTNRETKKKTLLMKGNSCSCLNKSLEDTIPQGDTSYTAVKCPGDNSSYAVYEIDVSYHFIANQTAGCGSVQPSEKIATFTNCSEKKGAYCTPLSNTDPTRLNQEEKMTWDDFKLKCEGRLASLNEIKNVNIDSKSSDTIFPSSRFWVGHRIWSYINYQFDPKLLTTSIKCGYYDPELGNVEFGSCLENYCYECYEKDETKGETTQKIVTSTENPHQKSTKDKRQSEMQAPNQITNIVIGGIAGTATVLLILLVIIYIKRKRARHIQPKPEPNEHQLIEKPKQPVYDETHLENDYDHLHEHQDTHNVGDVNVYDVSISCADVTNIGSDVYNTSKDFDCDKTYDYSTHNNLGKVDNSILNNDQYGTIPAST